MTPVARVAYQSGLGAVVTAQEAPEDVTGAAGELEGGCAGGASCELVPLGWLAAGLEAGLEVAVLLVPDGGDVGVPDVDGDDWLTVGLVVLA